MQNKNTPGTLCYFFTPRISRTLSLSFDAAGVNVCVTKSCRFVDCVPIC